MINCVVLGLLGKQERGGALAAAKRGVLIPSSGVQ